MLSIIKFFHIICGVSFLGITIAAFFYIARSIHRRDPVLIAYSLKASYFGDAIILLCVLIQAATAMSLVSAGHFTLRVPWIFIAYHAFGLLTLLWLLSLFIKKCYLSKDPISHYALKGFYVVNSAMIIIFIIIIHDAVTRSTMLDFLFK